MLPEQFIKRLCIIGVGLIGGSLARALRSAGVVAEIVGAGRDGTHLQKAQELGVIDRYFTDLQQAVLGADLVVLAVPLGAMESVIGAIAPSLEKKAILTDVGSAKGSVVQAVQKVFSKLPENFVPAHPIAGTEKNGVEASFASLYENRRVIMTPTPASSEQSVNKIKRMWQACGAEVIEMGIEHHDEVLAATSHLPHMLAFALVDTLARMDDSQEIFDFAAGGFKDFTRIASSDPQMWHDICLANHDALVKALEAFSDDLMQLAKAVRESNSEFIKATFTRAKQARDAFCEDRNISSE